MMMSTVRRLAFRVNPFLLELSYFIVLSLIGFFALKVSKPRPISFKLKDLDVFFTAVSSATVSSMSTVEMEVFSNLQLVFMTFLMFLGGECFTSWLGLHFFQSKVSTTERVLEKNKVIVIDHVELGLVTNNEYHNDLNPEDSAKSNVQIEVVEDIKLLGCVRVLARVVLSYIVVIHVVGFTLVAMYIGFVPTAKQVLKQKGLDLTTFAVFTTVSTFSNCGFVPTNENMIVFKRNPGLLLILIPQILLGNTLYPACLRLAIWFLGKTTRRIEFRQILGSPNGLGYGHLFSGRRSGFLAATVFGLIFLQLTVFLALEWRSDAIAGLTGYEKVVGSLFVVVNSRHTGESILDLSLLAPAVLALIVVMMYLPPDTTFFPIMDENNNSKTKGCSPKKFNIIEKILLSPLGNLSIFIILICITEREKMKEDPLNFNVLNIVVEVISAYGNVGFSTGYSCARQIKPEGQCKDKQFGFVGRWSNMGKFILIIVMFFGRLKKYHMKGGKAWKLS
ncbi:PREDICTED: sodium transporter HKT1 [Ipomoea nil]|uniref:sodium transporter HKT1 n=1 Tax=Ipomoea nil TaxID=35883 RepID=UPI000900A9D8|nr:PREDICTED: sodium transporter HKT1 [Ipomoea nil]